MHYLWDQVGRHSHPRDAVPAKPLPLVAPAQVVQAGCEVAKCRPERMIRPCVELVVQGGTRAQMRGDGGTDPLLVARQLPKSASFLHHRVNPWACPTSC